MLLSKTIDNAKNFFNKTLHSFKSFLFGDYRKLTRTPSLNLNSSNIDNPKMQQLDDFYREFCEQWDSTGKRVNKKRKVSVKRDKTESRERVINSEPRDLKNKEGDRGINIMEEHKPAAVSSQAEEKEVSCSKGGSKWRQSRLLEQKMKELEMMDLNDEDHVLDIEEALHYYSRLTSPIYQDLVDKFFTDMYSEFSLPQPTVKRNGIGGSMRLGPLNI